MTRRSPWPFPAAPHLTAKPDPLDESRDALLDEADDAAPEDEPYCVCDESPTEDEEASNTCASCGKLLS